MENQQTAAEEKERQERREAARKLLKSLETTPLDEALQLTSSMMAYMLLSSKIEPDSERWWDFFHAFQRHVSDGVESLGSVPSPLVH